MWPVRGGWLVRTAPERQRSCHNSLQNIVTQRAALSYMRPICLGLALLGSVPWQDISWPLHGLSGLSQSESSPAARKYAPFSNIVTEAINMIITMREVPATVVLMVMLSIKFSL